MLVAAVEMGISDCSVCLNIKKTDHLSAGQVVLSVPKAERSQSRATAPDRVVYTDILIFRFKVMQENVLFYWCCTLPSALVQIIKCFSK